MHVGVAQGCQNHVYGLILGLILQVVSPSKKAGIFIEFDFALYCPVNDVFAALTVAIYLRTVVANFCEAFSGCEYLLDIDRINDPSIDALSVIVGPPICAFAA